MMEKPHGIQTQEGLPELMERVAQHLEDMADEVDAAEARAKTGAAEAMDLTLIERSGQELKRLMPSLARASSALDRMGRVGQRFLARLNGPERHRS